MLAVYLVLKNPGDAIAGFTALNQWFYGFAALVV